MPHFFIKSNNINKNSIIISEKETYNHIAKSLRCKIGEKLLLVDENKIQYETSVSKITKSEIYAEILKRYKSKRILPFNIFLAQSPLNRTESQNYIMEKSTELGISGVFPILTDNCSVKQEVITKKIDKWQKIMVEASKQCERADIPKCFEITTLEKLLNENKFDKIIAFCERIAQNTLKDFIQKNKIKNNENILIIIGPEGGFSQREFEILKSNKKIEMLTLGELILKADTATVVALGNIIYEFTNNLKN